LIEEDHMSDASPNTPSGQPPRITRMSPWYPREGNVLPITLEVVQIAGAKLKVDLFKKPSEDVGDGSDSKKEGEPKT
jgi:hypothetical protein